MLYRKDLKSGNELSILGFGCMRFPRGISIDAEKTEKLILTAIEKGVNYFDTAYVYGGSEAALGEILSKRGLREKVNIATKLPSFQCARYEDFDRIFDEQKARLKTGYFDYYLIHNLSSVDVWRKLLGLGIEDWIAKKKASGEIRRIGFSFHGYQKSFADLLDSYGWEFCQIQYNYMNENYQAGRKGLKQASKKGLPVIVMEPLLGGKLAAGIPGKARKMFQDASPEISPAAWALRWLWNQPEVTVVLSGMNSLEQLEDNVKTAGGGMAGALTEKENAVIESVKKLFEKYYKAPCTGCNYCMPCPHSVNIPGCFAAYNASFAQGYITGLTQYLTSTAANHTDRNYRAVNCVKCGECEKKCPQHIQIVKLLGSVKKRMEPFWFGLVLKIILGATGSSGKSGDNKQA